MSKVNAQILASDTIFLSVLQLAERFPSGNLVFQLAAVKLQSISSDFITYSKLKIFKMPGGSYLQGLFLTYFTAYNYCSKQPVQTGEQRDKLLMTCLV